MGQRLGGMGNTLCKSSTSIDPELSVPLSFRLELTTGSMAKAGTGRSFY